MSAAHTLVTAVSIVLAITCVVLAVVSYSRTRELISPWTLFLGMALVDFYLPAALFFPVGLELPPWLSLLARDVALPAVLSFTLGAALFAWGYHRADSTYPPGPDAFLWWPSKSRLLVVVVIASGLFFLPIVASVTEAGGLSAYLSGRLTNRFAQPPASTSALMGLAITLRGMLLFVIFAAAGIAFAQRHAWRIFGYVVPAIAAAAAATTLLRGTLLTLLMGLAIVERARVEDLEARGVRHQTVRMNTRILALCVLGTLLFVSYGTARNYLTQQAYSGQGTLAAAMSVEATRFVRGEGFVGLLAIRDAYPRDVAFMGGRTIIDMLLLPIPRAIWPSKPLWYGIDDITRAMGWPASTQSAVTMPGELYANFADWGLPLMWVYGWLFGITRAYRYRPRFRYVYAFAIVPMMLPTFWMAFSGFVNGLTPIPFIALAVWFVFPQRPTDDLSGRTQASAETD